MLNSVDFPYFGGRVRHLRFDDNAICDYERETKSSFFVAMNQERFGFDSIRTLLWCGLKHEDQSLTPFKVGNWMKKYREETGTNLFTMIDQFSTKILDGIKESGLLDNLVDEPEEQDNSGKQGTEEE
jgi:hypothetical protein